jgi:hypothetical protein
MKEWRYFKMPDTKLHHSLRKGFRRAYKILLVALSKSWALLRVIMTQNQNVPTRFWRRIEF